MAPDLRRLEEVALNSSAPPGQLLYDGWLLRLAPGKAKRARSVNAVYPSRLPLEAKIAHCERQYGEARLPTLFRITPFSEPDTLDAALERRGYGRFETTVVEAAAIAAPARGASSAAEPMALEAWIDAVASLRGSPALLRDVHLARLRAIGLPMFALGVRSGGRVVAAGLAIVEGAWAGLFDILTDESQRRRGHARTLVAALLAQGWSAGARQAYLQVREDNESARRLYRAFGFAERYRYWYRARPGEQG